jgi:hypothetical protein
MPSAIVVDQRLLLGEAAIAIVAGPEQRQHCSGKLPCVLQVKSKLRLGAVVITLVAAKLLVCIGGRRRQGIGNARVQLDAALRGQELVQVRTHERVTESKARGQSPIVKLLVPESRDQLMTRLDRVEPLFHHFFR